MCGLPRPPSSCCCFRLSCASGFCPPRPPARGVGPRLAALRAARAPDACSSSGLPFLLHLLNQSFLGLTGTQQRPESPGAPRGSRRRPGAGCPAEGPLHHIPCTWLALCMLRSPRTCCTAPADPKVHSKVYFFLLVLIPEDFVGGG